MKKIFLILTLIFVNFMTLVAQNQHVLLTRENSIKTKLLLNGSSFKSDTPFKQFRSLELNHSILNGYGLQIGDTITLNLFEDQNYHSIIIKKSTDINGVTTYVSHFIKYHYSYCFISVSNGKASISIEIPELNQFYISRYQKDGKLYLIQIDEHHKNILEGGESIIPLPSKDQPIDKSQSKKNIENSLKNEYKNISSCLDTSDYARINVLIVYTPVASSWASTNEGGINNTIANSIARCNLASSNNHLKIHFNLAHSAQVSYTEVNANTDLTNLTNGNITNVYALRDSFAADLVVLFSFENSVGGLGWLLNESIGMANYGFSLSRVQQASWTYTTIHEIGHNMGAHHHKMQNTQAGPTSWSDWSANTWSAGWRWTGNSNVKYCDIMTYESGSYFTDGISHTRVAYFSDPLVSYQGVTVGDATDGDNARTLREIKHYIAQYRDSLTLQYCSAEGGNTLFGISSVQIGSLIQNSGTNPYYDFSNCAEDVTVETPIPVVVSITNSFSTQQLLVWVDWNDNKTFESGEQVYDSGIGGATQYSFSITPPSGTSAGLKRLRIRYHITSSGPNATPCGTSSHGEVQDFSLHVISSSCQAVTITTDPINQSTCNTSGVYLGVGVTGTTPIIYQWQFKNGASWVNVSNNVPIGATYTGLNSSSLGIFTITNSGNYEYRSIVSNCSSTNSDTSNSAIISIYTLPTQPSLISGDTIPCIGSNLGYSVVNISENTYNWSYPSDWDQISGGTTNSIVLHIGSNSGLVSVYSSNICGNGLSSVKQVTPLTVPLTTAIVGESSPCLNSIQWYQLPTDASTRFINWSFPTDWTILTPNQTTIGWNFENSTKRGSITNHFTFIFTPYTADSGSVNNSNLFPVSLIGGSEFSAWTTGASGYAPNSNKWDNGMNNKYWQIICNTKGLDYLKISSKQRSSSTGPKNFKIQYSINGLNWFDVSGGTITVADNYTSGVLNNLSLPFSCSNQDSLRIRWIMTSNTSVGNGTVGSAGTSRIDDIYIIGKDMSNDSVSVTVGSLNGTIVAIPSNSCGSGSSQTLNVTTLSVPEQPSEISGSTTVCSGSGEVLSYVSHPMNGVVIDTGLAMVSYYWEVPVGWTIVSGQSTDSITVTAGTVGGTISVTPSNGCGNGTTQTLNVTTLSVPEQPSEISGSTTVCSGTTGLSYSVTNIDGVTYTWSVPSGWSITAGQNSNTITVTAGTNSGTISVTPSNGCGNGIVQTLIVTTLSVPEQPSAIIGSTTVCSGTIGLTYSVNNIAGVTYIWSVPSGWIITTGQNSHTITVTAGITGGTISVTPSNGCGYGTPQTLNVTTLSVPEQPSNISGSSEVCSGTSGLTYSVTNTDGVTYTWSVPNGWSITAGQNSNTITVTAGTIGGTISVTPSNSCGNGAPQTLSVTTLSVPEQPSAISGSTTVCSGTTGLSYSVTNTAGVTYNWSVPSGWNITAGQNSNTITVTAGTVGGTISVTPSNSCGNGIAQFLTVSTLSVPEQPSAITGSTSVCSGSGEVLSYVSHPINGVVIDTGLAMVSYYWEVPVGWTIVFGQGTDSITVTAGTVGGTISVTPSNGCGNGMAQTLNVSTLSVQEQPSEISGSTTVCSGSGEILSYVSHPMNGMVIDTGLAMVSYYWEVPVGWTIVSGQGTDSITVTAGTVGGTISVTPSNGCGNGTTQTLNVTTLSVPEQPSAIIGSTTVCSGSGEILSYVSHPMNGVVIDTGLAMVSYYWEVPVGWTIVFGQGTDSITVTAGTVGGTISVTPSNGCGNGTPQTLNVTTLSVPEQPSEISGSTTVCSVTTGLSYSVTNIAGVTYIWSVPNGWGITAGENSNSITVTAGTNSGTISVTPSNGCGNGIVQTLIVTTLSVPEQPSAIIGSTTVCSGTTGLSYSVTNTDGVTYTWSVPNGWGITAGQNSNTITVTAGTVGGTISVTPSNTCGNGAPQTLNVTTLSVPEQPSEISGSTTVCSGTTGLSYSVTNIAGVTYIWNVPNGWGITAGENSNSITVTAGTVGGTISVTPSNSCGNGIAQFLTVGTLSVPEQPSAIIGSTTVCSGTIGLTYSVNNIAGVTYAWNVPNGWIITTGQNSHAITVTAGTVEGTISVIPSNGCGNGVAQSLTVSTLSVPEQPSFISGTTEVCSGTTGLTYSVTNIAGVTYAWSVPNGWNITAGENSNAITVTAGTFGGTISVTPSNTCGNGIAQSLTVSTLSVPEQPSAISGSTTVCSGTTGLTYSVNNIAGVTYTWNVPSGWSITTGQNSNTITVTAGTVGGTISVTPSNSCGNGIAQFLTVSTLSVPEQPSAIIGSTTVCSGTIGLTYSVNNIAGVTYAWNVPNGWIITTGQNSHAITVTAGTVEGTISVIPSNGCGNGVAQSLTVSTLSVPEQPSFISGTTEVCSGTTGLTYSVTNIAGVTYAWSVPNGWNITAGENSNAITVTAGTFGGTISVTPSNTCGNGIAQSLTVSTLSVPEQPSAISGSTTVCSGTTGLTYSVNNIAGVTYTWNVPSGWSITTGQNSNTITVTAGTVGGTISVTPSIGCGNGMAQILPVSTLSVPEQPSAISGSTTVCSGTSGLTYSVTNIAGVTYTWSVPSGWNITAGQNSNTITVTAGTVGGTISVTPSNNCGNGIAQSLTVSTLSVPEQPSAIIGSTTVCSGEILSYVCHPMNGVVIDTGLAMVSYYWEVPVGWTIVSGQGTDSITVTAGTVGGTISVTPSNGCGNGMAQIIQVDVVPIPTAPVISYIDDVLFSDVAFGNQWYNQFGAIENGTEQTLVPEINGSYFSIVTIDGCTSDSSNIIEVTNVGIEGYMMEQNILIYPNPTTDFIHIQNHLPEPIAINILDVRGKLLKKISCNEVLQVDFSHLANGLYLIIFEYKGQQLMKKIVKQ